MLMKTLKLLKGDTDEKLYDFELGKDILDGRNNAKSIKFYKLDIFKIKISDLQNTLIRK